MNECENGRNENEVSSVVLERTISATCRFDSSLSEALLIIVLNPFVLYS